MEGEINLRVIKGLSALRESTAAERLLFDI